MQTAEMIQTADGQVLAKLRAIHSNGWWASSVYGRPDPYLVDMLLLEIQELKEATYQPTEQSTEAEKRERMKAEYDAAWAQIKMSTLRPEQVTYPWLDISGKFVQCRLCHTLWSRDETPEGQRPGNWWDCPKGCKH